MNEYTEETIEPLSLSERKTEIDDASKVAKSYTYQISLLDF